MVDTVLKKALNTNAPGTQKDTPVEEGTDQDLCLRILIIVQSPVDLDVLDVGGLPQEENHPHEKSLCTETMTRDKGH